MRDRDLLADSAAAAAGPHPAVACLARDRSLFWWGDDAPTPARWGRVFSEAEVSNTNAFGLVGMGAFPELCEGGVVRGGAAELHPWQDVGEWQLMLCGLRGEPAGRTACLRLVRRLDDLLAGPPQVAAKPRAAADAPPPTSFDDAQAAARHAENARALRLHDLRLKKVPAAVRKLTHLETLDLSVNHLEVLPDFLTELRALRRLDISGNRFESVPEIVATLETLEELAVGSSRLRELPASLFGLSQLRGLDVSWSNRLRAIPDGIAKLQNLERLKASMCSALKFPVAVTRLPKLNALDLAECDITELPEAIGDLTLLRSLDLSRCKVAAFPSGLEKLTELEELRFRDCNLEQLPSFIAKLTSLRVLDLFECTAPSSALEMPASFADLVALERLYLCRNRLTRIPEPVFAMRSLRELNLLGNDIAYDAKAIERLATMPALSVVEVGQNEDLVAHEDEIRRAMPERVEVKFV